MKFIDEKQYWTTKDGRKLTVDQMSTNHIKNALNTLKERGYVGLKTLNFYMSCPLPHGEMAMDAFDQEFDWVSSAPVSKWVDIFEEELKNRGE